MAEFYCTCDAHHDPCPVHDAPGADPLTICDVCCERDGASVTRERVVALLRPLRPVAITYHHDEWQTVAHSRGDHLLCPRHQVAPRDFWPEARP